MDSKYVQGKLQQVEYPEAPMQQEVIPTPDSGGEVVPETRQETPEVVPQTEDKKKVLVFETKVVSSESVAGHPNAEREVELKDGGVHVPMEQLIESLINGDSLVIGKLENQDDWAGIADIVNSAQEQLAESVKHNA